MARYLGPKCRLSRREGVDLFLKSPIRSLESKCKAKSKPGQHGSSPKKFSDFSLQFREKQKVKRLYGVLETQFVRYYREARRLKGNAGNNLLRLLETRLDNFVYRAGFSVTRAEARQMVTHKNIKVNDKKVNLPSYQIAVGDVISLTEKANRQVRFDNAIAINRQLDISPWLDVNFDKKEATFSRYPDRDELDANINENMIIELYSK